MSLAAALLLAACATEIRDETPGRAEALPPVRTQMYMPGAVTPVPVPGQAPVQAPVQDGRWRTLSQIRAEANARPERQVQAQAQTPAPAPDPAQPRPQRRRGSSSPPPEPLAMPTPGPLPTAPSTEAMTDRFKRDLMSPEVDRLRADDALGRLDPLQQRELFRKEQDLRQYGTGPLGR